MLTWRRILRGGICNSASRWRCAWDAAAFKMLIRSGRIQNLKTLGVIGGIGPESTIEYYRLLFRAYRDRHPDGSNPSILINSINMKHLLTMIEANEFSKMAEYLVKRFKDWPTAAQPSAFFRPTPHMSYLTR